jgi:fructuronate reductase
MKERLSQERLATLEGRLTLPSYDRARIETGIVHFGPGAFHRVHQAWFMEQLLAGDPRWGICGVSLRNRDVRDALVSQDCLYTLAIRDEATAYQVIGSIREVLFAMEQQSQVLERLAAPATRLVTMTVTEKGYCLAGDGSLDLAHADILHDLKNPRAPMSLIGYLVEGLARRRAAGLGPFTVISCDNLVDNGAKLARATVRLAAERDAALAKWIESHVAFPRTMVDSITPATTDALKQSVAEVLGVEDRWPVQREAFAQWVVEDRFSSEVPDWARAGVTVTDDVPAYDRAKLRLLNGAHSTLAYVGTQLGYETVAQAMGDEDLAEFLRVLMTEDILPTLKAPRGLDLRLYVESILKRFRNPSIRHQLAQIAWDGSQKLPFRLHGTIQENLAAGRSIERLSIAIAAWMRFVRRNAQRGVRVTDPLADRLLEIGRATHGRASSDVPLFLAIDSMFPAALASDARFVRAVSRAYDELDVARFPRHFIAAGSHSDSAGTKATTISTTSTTT